MNAVSRSPAPSRKRSAGSREPAVKTVTPWRSRVVGDGEVPPDQLLAHPLNWRVHDKEQQRAIAGALSEVGSVATIMIDRRTEHVVDGHPARRTGHRPERAVGDYWPRSVSIALVGIRVRRETYLAMRVGSHPQRVRERRSSRGQRAIARTRAEHGSCARWFGRGDWMPTGNEVAIGSYPARVSEDGPTCSSSGLGSVILSAQVGYFNTCLTYAHWRSEASLWSRPARRGGSCRLAPA